MAKWIRNWHTPYTADAWGVHHVIMMHKEMLLVGGYTVDSDDSDAAWTAAGNIVVDEAGGANGFQVSAGAARNIYDPLGRFTQAMVDDECAIGLRGGLLDDDQNHSIWRITDYIDANNALVDADGFSPFGWVTDTQLAGRIFKFDGTKLGDGAWVLMDAPAGSRTQIYLTRTDGSYGYARVAPFGKPYAATAVGGDTIGGTAPTMTLNVAAGQFNKHMVGLNVTIAGSTTPANDGTFPITAVSPTGQITYTNASGVAEGYTGSFSVAAIATQVGGTNIQIGDYYNNRFMINAYVDGANYLAYGVNQDGDVHFLNVATLDGADDEDTDPTYITGEHGWLGPFNTGAGEKLYMLDGAASPSQITAWLVYNKLNSALNEANGFHRLFGRRVDVYGQADIEEPYVQLDNTATVGACIRGRAPHIGVGYTEFQKMRPMDSAGAWLHWFYGLFVPRNGPNDQLPKYPEVS